MCYIMTPKYLKFNSRNIFKSAVIIDRNVNI